MSFNPDPVVTHRTPLVKVTQPCLGPDVVPLSPPLGFPRITDNSMQVFPPAGCFLFRPCSQMNSDLFGGMTYVLELAVVTTDGVGAAAEDPLE